MSKKKVNLFVPIVAAVVIGLLAVLIGCQEKKDSIPPEQMSHQLSSPFTAQAKIKTGEMTLQADINKTAPEAFTFQVLEPANLKDLQFAYDGKDVTVSYQGMSVSVGDDSLIAKGMASIIMKAINSASADTGVTVRQQDGAVLLKGENEDGKFSMKLDKKNGSILSMEMPEMDLKCEFDNFAFQKPSEPESTSSGAEEIAESSTPAE